MRAVAPAAIAPIAQRALSTSGLLALGGLAWSLGGAAAAQIVERPVVAESVLIVTAEPRAAASFETQHELTESEVNSLRASTAAEVLRRLPSVHVPTNTRGESIAFVRNAHERQVGVFYDGAAINVPWDNRLDLSLFPAPLIGGVRSAAGPIAPHYGVNSLAAINLVPREGGADARSYVAVEGGEEGLADGSLFLPFSWSGVDFSFGLSALESDGDPLSGDAGPDPVSSTVGPNDVAYQIGRDVRTNTDRQLFGAFGRASFELANHDIAFTLMHVDAEKGIAAEETSDRFWRYPELTNTVGVLSVQSELGPQTQLHSAGWIQAFEQTINQYSNITYSTITARQFDEDLTFGLREVLTHQAGPTKLVGSFSVLESSHDQRDVTASTLALEYGQRNWSIGGEAELALTPTLIAEIGAGYDLVEFLETGNKPPRDNFEGPTGRIGLIWAPANDWRIHASIGHKVRTPTMRELFGEALNRFLLNPDLEPERITTAEIGLEWQGERGNFYLIPFAQNLDGTIDQRNVPNPPGPALRQRINLRGSEVRGVELGGMYELNDDWTIRGDATYAEARRLRSSPTDSVHLAEKPELLASLGLDYDHPSGFGGTVEIEHLGRAYSADTTGALVALDASTQGHIEINYTLSHGDDRESEFYLRAHNVTDEFVLPQFGLPAPGRLISAGVRHSW